MECGEHLSQGCAVSQLDSLLLGHSAAPGEDQAAHRYCLAQAWLLFALDFVFSYLWSDNRENPGLLWGWGLPGAEVHGVGVRTIQQLPDQLPLASLREAGLLRAEHLSFLSVLRPDTCFRAKDETQEAEPGRVLSGQVPVLARPLPAATP